MPSLRVISSQLCSSCSASAGDATADLQCEKPLDCEKLLDLVWFYGSADAISPASLNDAVSQSVPNSRQESRGKTTEQALLPKAGEEQLDDGSAQSCSQPSPSGTWLRHVFDRIDENKDGLVSSDEVRRLFEKLGFESSNVHCLVHGRTTAKDGADAVAALSHDEFVLLYHGKSTCQDNSSTDNADFMHCGTDKVEEDVLLEAFNIYDENKDGLISPTELQLVLCRLGFVAARELDACVEMIEKYDQDGNGQLDFQEFKDMFYSDIMSD